MPVAVAQTCGVYEIRNRVNGKVYVGSSLYVQRRMNTHRRKLRRGVHENVHLLRAWLTYGEEAFEFALVESCTPGEQVGCEQKWMDGHPYTSLYNAAPAITGSACKGRVLTAEHRRKIGAANKGKASWNKGHENTWHEKITNSILANRDFEYSASHEDDGTLYFASEAEAVQFFGYKRKRVNESVRLGHRLTTGWLFSKTPKEVCHSGV